MNKKPWNLVADIGGTNARFARSLPHESTLDQVMSVGVAEYGKFDEALQRYLGEAEKDESWMPLPRAACFAVACRADEEIVRFTNSPWTFTRSGIGGVLQQAPLTLINDFAATGYGVSFLTDGDWMQIGGADALPGSPIAVLGPGTGLGVSIVVPGVEAVTVVDGEGGHVDFAPVTAEEIRVLEILAARFGRVSVERLLSGAGLVNIHQSLAQLAGVATAPVRPEDITGAGVADESGLAGQALHMFCRVLGSVAGNLALTAGARGGVYITGGIVPAILDFFAASDFRQRFEAKGRFSDYVGRIPVRVVTRQDLGLTGAAVKLVQSGF